MTEERRDFWWNIAACVAVVLIFLYLACAPLPALAQDSTHVDTVTVRRAIVPGDSVGVGFVDFSTGRPRIIHVIIWALPCRNLNPSSSTPYPNLSTK